MKEDCTTCEYNMSDGKRRVCANEHYGYPISDILRVHKELKCDSVLFPCSGYRVAFHLWQKKNSGGAG